MVIAAMAVSRLSWLVEHRERCAERDQHEKRTRPRGEHRSGAQRIGSAHAGARNRSHDRRLEHREDAGGGEDQPEVGTDDAHVVLMPIPMKNSASRGRGTARCRLRSLVPVVDSASSMPARNAPSAIVDAACMVSAAPSTTEERRRRHHLARAGSASSRKNGLAGSGRRHHRGGSRRRSRPPTGHRPLPGRFRCLGRAAATRQAAAPRRGPGTAGWRGTLAIVLLELAALLQDLQARSRRRHGERQPPPLPRRAIRSRPVA